MLDIVPHYDAATQTVELLGRTYNVYSFLRMLCWIFGYVLLRPYLIKLGGMYQKKDHAREISEQEMDSMAAARKADAGEETLDSDEDEDVAQRGWGVKAVRRAKRQEAQRKALLENMEKRGVGDVGEESEEELEDLLEQ